MKLAEKHLKAIIAEEIQNALSGNIDIPEYEIGKSIKKIAAMLDAEAEKFLEKYDMNGLKIYDSYGSKLYDISEKLERFIKEFKKMEDYL